MQSQRAAPSGGPLVLHLRCRTGPSNGEIRGRTASPHVVHVSLTSNLRWAAAPGNVLLPAEHTGLPKDSVANVSQVVAVDRTLLIERVGHLSDADLALVQAGLDLVLARE